MALYFLLFGNQGAKKCLLAGMKFLPYLCTAKTKKINNLKYNNLKRKNYETNRNNCNRQELQRSERR